MNERVEEYRALCDKVVAGNKILQGALEALRRATEAMPWEREKHPAGADAYTLRKEIRLAAEAAGVDVPELPEPPRFEGAGELRKFGIDLAAWANPGDHVVMARKEFEKDAAVAFEQAMSAT